MFDWFGADRFERALRSAAKHYDIKIAEKTGENEYVFSKEATSVSVDTTEVRREFARTRSQETADIFAEKILRQLDLEKRLVSFTNAQAFLRLIAVNEREVRRGMITGDFAGSLKKAVCYTSDGYDITMLDEAVLKRWAVPKEVLFSVADRNMGRIFAKTEYNCSQLENGITVYEYESKGDPLTVSMMMCTDFHDFISEKLGDIFYAAAPSRESMLAVGDGGKSMLESLAAAVVRDNKWADEPLTTDIFRFSPSGVTIVNGINTD